MYRTIVVGTDGSDTGTLAVERAAGLAAGLGAHLVVVTAYEPGAAWPKRSSRHPARRGSGKERSHDEVEAILLQARDLCRAAGMADVVTRSVLGDPAVALLDVAGEVGADVIVVGNVGVSGGMRFLLGSVPNRVLHRAPCDVIVALTKEAVRARRSDAHSQVGE